MAERTKKFEAVLFQVRAQLERTSSVKLNEMLSFLKSASNKTGLRYDFSSPNIASSSTTMFVSPTDNVNSKNDEGKTKIASEIEAELFQVKAQLERTSNAKLDEMLSS